MKSVVLALVVVLCASSSFAAKPTKPTKTAKPKKPAVVVVEPAPVVEAPPPPPPPPPVVEAPPAKTTRRLAVYELDAAGIDPRVARVLTDSVVAELRKLERTVVVGMDEIRAMLDLEAQKQILGCTDESCLAEIGAALGVDGVIIGSVAVIGDSTTFGLKHIDQATATTLAQSTKRLDGVDPVNVLAAVGPAVQELFPDLPLKAGTTRGVPEKVALRIHPPPLSPVVFWSLVGGAGAAVLVGGGFTAVNAITANDTITTLNKGVADDKEIDGATLTRQLGTIQATFIGTVVSYGVAGALLAGAGVTALFTDWDNLRTEE